MELTEVQDKAGAGDGDDDLEDLPLIGNGLAEPTPVEPTEAAERRLTRSALYVASFVSMGFAVGALGPALPELEASVGSDSLAPAFVARGVGGVVASSAAGAVLHRFPVRGHELLCVGCACLAAAHAVLTGAGSVASVALALFLLDFGCGVLQVGNSLMVWVQPEALRVTWLNLLNGSFGIGTLLTPALVAAFTGSGDHAAGVRATEVLLCVCCALAAATMLTVRSPSQPVSAKEAGGDGGGDASSAGWRRVLWVVGTALAMNASVGGETTFGTFLEAYVGAAREDGRLDMGDAAADLLTSAYWTSFTVGRFGASAVAVAIPWLSPEALLAAQLATMQLGALLPILLPGSAAALWTGAVLVGAGVAGLVAGFLAQLSRHLVLDGATGGFVAVGTMSGVAVWQTCATAVGARHAVEVVAVATLVAIAAQAVLVVALGPGRRSP